MRRTHPGHGITLATAVSLALPIAGGGCAAPAARSADPAPPAATGKTAKREGPSPVPPVRIGQVEYAAVHWGFDRGLAQNGGYVAARDVASGRELWLLKVYDVRYDPARERDVQDTFIVALEPDPSGTALLVRDELDRRYHIELRTQTVRQVGGR